MLSYADVCKAAGAPDELNVMGGVAQADARGRYYVEVRTPRPPAATACLRVTAYAPATAGALPTPLASAERAGVRLRDGGLSAPPRATVRVDFSVE